MVEASIPKEQWAVQVYQGGKWVVERAPVPVPQKGQVLIKLECAPVNPSDTYFLSGQYDNASDVAKITYPIAPGWEGSGTVVASGGGFLAWRLVGKRVACSKTDEPDFEFKIGGTYQQYMITSALQCLPLPDEVTFEEGAMHFVNPITALGLLDKLKQHKAEAGIQTAAASQLGRMINRLCLEQGIPMINVIRKEEQAKLLKDMGCPYVLNSSDSDFLDQLAALAKKLKATVCFEAIAGSMTGQVMSKMPTGSICYLYGCLSEQKVCDIDPLSFMGRNQTLKPFLLNEWLKEKRIWTQLGIIRKCQNYLRDKTFSSIVAKRISMFELKEGLEEYKKNMSAGKYIIYPQREPTNDAEQKEESKQE